MMNAAQQIHMPDIGDFGEVEIIEIAVAAGDQILVDDVIMTIESDKASMDIPCEISGVVSKLLVAVGDKVSQGNPILLLESGSLTESVAADETDVKNTAHIAVSEVVETDKGSKVEKVNKVTELTSHQPVVSITDGLSVDKKPIASAGPAARRLVRELGLDIAQISGSGRRGRILKQDVKFYAKARLSKTMHVENTRQTDKVVMPDLSRYGSTHSESLNKIETVTGANMQRAWALIPHAWLQHDVDVTELEAGRQRVKPSVTGLTMTALLVKALAVSLVKFPRFNTALDDANQQLIYRDYIHIGVAVDTPKGLVVAVIRDVDQLNITAIAAELSRLSQRAREGKLTPDQMQGASMTISNLGGMKVNAIQPIVNWPEVAILGVAASTQRPMMIENQVQPRLIMPLTLGFDHRVINGADGARLLQYLHDLLSDPMQFLAVL